MDLEQIKLWQWLAGQIIVAAAIWTGIRVDIKNIHRRLDEMRDSLKSTNQNVKDVHKRVDELYKNHNYHNT